MCVCANASLCHTDKNNYILHHQWPSAGHKNHYQLHIPLLHSTPQNIYCMSMKFYHCQNVQVNIFKTQLLPMLQKHVTLRSHIYNVHTLSSRSFKLTAFWYSCWASVSFVICSAISCILPISNIPCQSEIKVPCFKRVHWLYAIQLYSTHKTVSMREHSKPSELTSSAVCIMTLQLLTCHCRLLFHRPATTHQQCVVKG